MSLFGSREDDPLLQDDPLVPSDDESSAPSARAPDEAPEESAPSPQAPEETSDSPPGGNTSSSRSQSGPSSASDTGDRAALSGEEARRALVRGVDAAEAGNLSALNTAFDQGWRLDKVVYREETADLLFLLHQQGDGADQNGLIM